MVAVDDPSQDAHVLESAVQRAEQEEKGLVAVNVIPGAAYRDRRNLVMDSRDLRRDGVTYTLAQAQTEAKVRMDRELRRIIGDRDVSFEAVGNVGELVPTAVKLAGQYNCPTVLVEETPSSLWERLGLSRARYPASVIRVRRPPTAA